MELEIWGVWQRSTTSHSREDWEEFRRWGEEEGGEGGAGKGGSQEEGLGVEKKRRIRRGGEEKREGEKGKDRGRGREGAGRGGVEGLLHRQRTPERSEERLPGAQRRRMQLGGGRGSSADKWLPSLWKPAPSPGAPVQRPRVSCPEDGHLLGPVGATSLLKQELFNSSKLVPSAPPRRGSGSEHRMVSRSSPWQWR